MDQKQNTTASFSLKRVHKLIEHMKSEFHKIQWTEETELRTCARIVVAATFVAGMVIYFADLIVQKVLHGFDVIFRFIFG